MDNLPNAAPDPSEIFCMFMDLTVESALKKGKCATPQLIKHRISQLDSEPLYVPSDDELEDIKIIAQQTAVSINIETNAYIKKNKNIVHAILHLSI